MTSLSAPRLKSLALLLVLGLAACGRAGAGSNTSSLPNPRLDAPLAAVSGEQTLVLAGGCFWGVEAVFEHVKGVKQVWSGYVGGSADSADYGSVSSGRSSHAESVKITYDPKQISYGHLLKVFFSVAHDPTQLNRQGPDVGTQYRSAIFYGNAEQQRIASAYITQLGTSGAFSRPIVTQLVALKTFYPAEAYHQDFARLNPRHPYIVYHDLPKVARLKQQFPGFYRGN